MPACVGKTLYPGGPVTRFDIIDDSQIRYGVGAGYGVGAVDPKSVIRAAVRMVDAAAFEASRSNFAATVGYIQRALRELGQLSNSNCANCTWWDTVVVEMRHLGYQIHPFEAAARATRGGRSGTLVYHLAQLRESSRRLKAAATAI